MPLPERERKRRLREILARIERESERGPISYDRTVGWIQWEFGCVLPKAEDYLAVLERVNAIRVTDGIIEFTLREGEDKIPDA